MSLLEEAIQRRGIALICSTDRHCRSVAELRSVIVKARALALGEAERERAAEGVKRWLLERERAAWAAAGDKCPRCILCPISDDFPSAGGAEGHPQS
jgi:hypothetical protein